MRVLFSKGIAFISKPRCGSTSMRRVLDSFISQSSGDIVVDVAGQNPPFHPHITAPYLKEILGQDGGNSVDLEYFTVTRNPIEVLNSYYEFFQPDENSRYNYEPGWSGNLSADFEKWVLNGRVGSDPNWLRLAPRMVSTDNLSPLSLEAHVYDQYEKLSVDHIFPIEEPGKLIGWLETKLELPVSLPHVNQSRPRPADTLGKGALDKIRSMMPIESLMYGI